MKHLLNLWKLSNFQIICIVVLLILFEVANAQDIPCCKIIYRYDEVNCETKKPYFMGVKLEFFCDTPYTIVNYSMVHFVGTKTENIISKVYPANKRYYLINFEYYYKFENNLEILFSEDKFLNGDTSIWRKRVIDNEDTIYSKTIYIPNEIYCFNSKPIYKFKEYGYICKENENGILQNCEKRYSGYTFFHPFYGFIKYGDNYFRYYEISNTKVDEKGNGNSNIIEFEGNCDEIIKEIDKKWSFWMSPIDF